MKKTLQLFIAIILIFFPQIPRSDWPMRVALSMQLGGAAGNLIDRLSRGEVTDFVSVGNFAVFNVADASISTVPTAFFFPLDVELVSIRQFT